MQVKYKTEKFTMEVGRFIAKSVEQSIRRSAFDWDVQVTIEKHIGILEGFLLVTATGEASRVTAYIRTLESVFKGIEDEDM